MLFKTIYYIIVFLNTNVFSGSIRYIKDGKVYYQTLGMLTQHGRQLGSVFADQLITLIAKVGKGADDIYSTCSIKVET